MTGESGAMNPEEIRRASKREKAVLGFGVFHIVLLQFAVEGGFADAEDAGGGEFVTAGLAQGT